MTEEELARLSNSCQKELITLLSSIKETIERVENDRGILREGDDLRHVNVLVLNYDNLVQQLEDISDPMFSLDEDALGSLRVEMRGASLRNQYVNSQIGKIYVHNALDPFVDESVSDESVSDETVPGMTWWQRGATFFSALFLGRNNAQLYPEVDENIERQLERKREELLKQQEIENRRIEEIRENREKRIKQQEINEQRQEKWNQERAERREKKERELEEQKERELEEQEREREEKELKGQGKIISSDPTVIESGESRSVYDPLAGVVMPFDPLEPLPLVGNVGSGMGGSSSHFG